MPRTLKTLQFAGQYALRFVWRIFKRVVQIGFIAKPFRHALGVHELKVVWPKIDAYVPSSRKQALVVIPFTENNGYYKCVEILNESLLEMGYDLHVIVCNPEGVARMDPTWKHSYYVPNLDKKMGHFHRYDDSGEWILDGDKVDDWWPHELQHFVTALTKEWSFDLCLVHYAFLSKVLEFLPESTFRILYTHDVYSNRNTRLLEAGLEDSLWFSTEPQEERKALDRADLALTVQEDEAEFFRKLVSPAEKIKALPLLKAPRFIDGRVRPGQKIRIGYFASRYANNVKALEEFYALFKQSPELKRSFVLRVAGNICDRYTFKSGLYTHIEFCGTFDDPYEFYEMCDLAINPDFFESGIKMKALEAMSFGMPCLLSKVSLPKLPLASRFHQLVDMNDMINALNEIARTPELLNELREAAKTSYLNWRSTYNAGRLIVDAASSLKRERPVRNNNPASVETLDLSFNE